MYLATVTNNAEPPWKVSHVTNSASSSRDLPGSGGWGESGGGGGGGVLLKGQWCLCGGHVRQHERAVVTWRSYTLWIFPFPNVDEFPIITARPLSCSAPARISEADALFLFTRTASGLLVKDGPSCARRGDGEKLLLRRPELKCLYRTEFHLCELSAA